MKEPIYFLNGAFLPESECKITVTDLGLLRGYGIFDFFKAVNGNIIFLEDHLDRLAFSTQQLDLKVPYTKEELKTILSQVIQKNTHPLLGIKIIVTGGYSLDGYTPTNPNFIIIAKPFTYFNKPQGMHLMSLEYVRENPTIKTLNYAVPIQHLPQMKAMGADDFLYHKDGKISELSRSNIFIVKNNVIITPNNDVLWGVTRKNILTLAKNKWKVEEREVSLQEVFEADEVFTTGSTKKVTAITQIDQKLINNGNIGLITQQLLHDFEELEKTYLN